ncbi:hypothetical protein ACH5RR_017839 [Cinchona calisaya]|uniref:TIR domain-containing protein n=1 Tax=Cinchona calisaya TaxID=153742 RepID=A0ABD2ZND3_9GENT
MDTRRNVALLIYDHLKFLNLEPFLDCKNLNPGDKLIENLDKAVLQSKVGIAVFSPNYCESYYCRRELSLMIESKKRVIPIYCDITPHDLEFKDWRSYSPNEHEMFNRALEEAKDRVGITFDTSTGIWSDFLAKVSGAVKSNLFEVVEEENNLEKEFKLLKGNVQLP